MNLGSNIILHSLRRYCDIGVKEKMKGRERGRSKFKLTERGRSKFKLTERGSRKFKLTASSKSYSWFVSTVVVLLLVTSKTQI